MNDGPLTEDDEYHVWSEKMSILLSKDFRIASSQQEDLCVANRYERRYDRSWVSNNYWMKDEETNVVDAGATHRTNTKAEKSRYADAERFPPCFYAALLRCTENGQQAGTCPSNYYPCGRHPWQRPPKSTIVSTGPRNHQLTTRNDPMEYAEVFSSISQQFELESEDVAMERVAAALRRSIHVSSSSPEEKQGAPTVSAATFYGDARIEALQAQIHSELTELLLEVRHRNAAADALRSCAAKTRFLQSNIAIEGPSGSG